MQLAVETNTQSFPGTQPAYYIGIAPPRESAELEEVRPLTDDQLVFKARSGDKTALNELIERHYKTCLNLAFSILRNRTDAEDEVQNACCKAFERFGQYQGDGSFAAWLNRIVANESISRYRQHRSLRLNYLDDPLTRFNSATFEIVDKGCLPDEALGLEEVAGVVSREVNRLPLRFREVLVLRDIQQLPMQTVSRQLGITVPAAKSRLARARTELRGRLDKYCGQHPHRTLLQGSKPRRIAAVVMNRGRAAISG